MQIVVHTVLSLTEGNRAQSTLGGNSQILFLHSGVREFQILQSHHFTQSKSGHSLINLIISGGIRLFKVFMS